MPEPGFPEEEKVRKDRKKKKTQKIRTEILQGLSRDRKKQKGALQKENVVLKGMPGLGGSWKKERERRENSHIITKGLRKAITTFLNYHKGYTECQGSLRQEKRKKT